MSKEQAAFTRFYGMATLVDRVGISRSSAYEKMNERSPRFDPDFVKPIKCGRRTLFVEAEVEAWLQARIKASRADS